MSVLGGRTEEGLPLLPLKLMAVMQGLIVIGYLGLLFAGSAEIRPGAVTTLLMLVPAVAVVPGLWRGHYKTMVWAALFDLFYLLVAATDAWAVPADRGWHLLIAIVATIGFLAAWWHSIRRRRLLKSRRR
ncbi:MAG: DUF2069 domain-containing protein [Guyparkeria sp.]|uniref:DUF2069 domain-containing protein n=1 Tax=Guyparkeria sp. TaxID=2035736 RepID=UPI003978C3D7